LRQNPDGNGTVGLAGSEARAAASIAAGGVLTLGIDPGIAICGFGLVAEEKGALHMIAYGAITTQAGEPPAERLRVVYRGLRDLIGSYHPADVAVEELFFNKNVRTALQVGQARGVAMLAAAEADLDVAEYTPLQVKQAMVGYGRAAKSQVQEMVRVMLGLDRIPEPDDAADALAVAICHIHSRQVARRLGVG
jgi:crossover junction endodeoxyribonuclease RuvC